MLPDNLRASIIKPFIICIIILLIINCISKYTSHNVYQSSEVNLMLIRFDIC